MAAVAAVKPKVEVHAIVSCAENMPDGDAYRPGDIWGSLDGKTVEIINTDAEGRLVLADALAYARALQPDLIVDNATLTGACMVALGSACSGWYASNEDTAREFAGALKASGEQMWRMPLLEDLREQIKSDVADVKQTGDRYGGSITAALFLREFVGQRSLGSLRHRRPRRPGPPERLDAGQGRDGTRRADVPRHDRAERRALSRTPMSPPYELVEGSLAARYPARSPTFP